MKVFMATVEITAETKEDAQRAMQEVILASLTVRGTLKGVFEMSEIAQLKGADAWLNVNDTK